MGLSLVLLGLSFLPAWTARTDPAVIFLSLAAVFVFIQYAAPIQWQWKGWLYPPTTVFFAFGLIFLLNAITNDWSAWAYAWMLCITAAGIGLALAARTTGQTQLLYKIGLWGAAGSAVLFAVFGAIAGGPFMRIFSILIFGGVGLLMVLWATHRIRFLNWEWAAPVEEISMTEPVSLDPGANQALVEPLSKRELEVLHWIQEGLSNPEIAQKMVVADSTVKTHINNIYSKLDVKSRTQALHRAKDLGLL